MLKAILSITSILFLSLAVHAVDIADGFGDDQPLPSSASKDDVSMSFGDEKKIEEEPEIYEVSEPVKSLTPLEETKALIDQNSKDEGKAFNELPDQDEDGCLIGDKGNSCRRVLDIADSASERAAAKKVKSDLDITVSVKKCTDKEFYYTNFEACDYFFNSFN